MGRKMRRLLAIVLVLMLMSSDLAVIAEVIATLELPESLTVIEEEAFYGDTSIEKVVVPEGTTEIQSKAFADSSLAEIELPSTLTSIADDAFEGCNEITVTAPEDSYAYDWAVEQGYINTYTSIWDTEGVTFYAAGGSNRNYGQLITSEYYGKMILLDASWGGWFYLQPEDEGYYTLTFLNDNDTSDWATICGYTDAFEELVDLSAHGNIEWRLKVNSRSTTPVTQNTRTLNKDEKFYFWIPDNGQWYSSFDYPLKTVITFTPSDVTPIDFVYSIDYGRVTIKGYTGSEQTISIPNTIDGYPMTTIGEKAFESKNITSIYIPATVVTIGSSAFDNCPSDLVIYGESGSYAETYAAEQGITFSTDKMPGTVIQFGTNEVWNIGSSAAELEYWLISQEDWNATYVPEWVSLSSSSGSSGDMITVNVEANAGLDRTDYVRFETDSQYADLIIKQSGDAGSSLPDPVITYPAEDNAVVELVDVHVLWDAVDGADRYIFSLRDLTTDSLLAYHMESSDDGTDTEITLPVTYFAAGHSYRVAIGAVAEKREFYDSTTSWAERVFEVECTIDDNRTSLSGEVVSAAGNPIEGATVSICTSAGYYDNVRVATAVTGADGSWKCEGLYRGTTYFCNAEKKNYTFSNDDVTVIASGEENIVDTIISDDSLESEVFVFSAYPTQWECSEEAESVETYITAEDSWIATADVDWITLSVDSGNGSGAIGIDVAANSTMEARNGTITVVSGENEVEVIISQEAADGLQMLSLDTVITVNTTIDSGDNIAYPGDLIVKDDLYFNGGSITVEGDMTVKAKGRIDLSNGGTITVKGDFIFDSNMDHSTYLTDGVIKVAGDVEIKRNFYASGDGKNEFHVTGSNVHEVNMWNKWVAADQYFNDFIIDDAGIEALKIKEPFSCNGEFNLGDWGTLMQDSDGTVLQLERTNSQWDLNYDPQTPADVMKRVQIGTLRSLAEHGTECTITGTEYIATDKTVTYSYLKDDKTFGSYTIDIITFNAKVSDGKAMFGQVIYTEDGKSYHFLIRSSLMQAFEEFHKVVKKFAFTGLTTGWEDECKDVVKSLILDELPWDLGNAYSVTESIHDNYGKLKKCYSVLKSLN